MNYVFYFPDELRAESMACYGHPLVQTPNFDALAAEGTLFEQNYTQHPVCMASRCALITGWYPHVRGHRTLKYEVDNSEPNFFRSLKQAGFTTGLFGKNHMLTSDAFAQSFTENSPITFGHMGSKQPNGTKTEGIDPKEEDSAKPMRPFGGFSREPVTDPDQRRKNYMMLSDPISSNSESLAGMGGGDAKNVEQGIEFIRNHAQDDNPFFLFLPLGNPHPPYTVIENMYEMYSETDVPMKDMKWLEGKPELYEACRRFRESGDSDYEAFRKVNAIYLAMVSYTDMLFGLVVDELKAQGIYDDTVIIVCSDHGDWAGDCGLIEKWPSALDDMLTRVPLIIRKPGGSAGHRVATPTQNIDIFPTVFDIEGLGIDHDQFGVSLLPQLLGAAGDGERIVYSEGGYDVREPHCFEGTPSYAPLMIDGTQYYPKMAQQQQEPETVCRCVMQRDNRYKFIYRSNGEGEIYDMLEDPQEYRNLFDNPDYVALRKCLTETMLRWMISTSDVVPRAGHE